ncbi:queuine tRNA-ribosyltransferase accessory subunit 2-like [Triticum dicoccoides]|uniref:queuine tRNA-ribosyltransferase accessory subunit 2-like n=1 Tax=Triticum dicoccoides TaxID=85692 RepID=UPI000E7C58ED|nr:queuine tRNA-ribosyltransferase accessory subunit 2-like [Triticum dicoccoides]
MRFAVTKVCASGAKARAGLLQIGSSGVETPALLLSTRKGLPAFMSPDLLSSLPLPDSLLLNVCPTHFIEVPPSKTISNIGGLHRMLGLPDHILVAAAGESTECLPSSDATNKFGASFETPAGRKLVKPSDYMELISCLQPNLWASLADEVPAWVNEKRNKTSVERTLRWLDACIALDAASGRNSLGVVVGGSSIEQRKLCATEVSKRNVSGFWIGGFGLGESVEERCSLLNAVTDCLPLGKPRIVSRLGLPEEVLEGVASGIDLFDSTYIYQLTMGGFALIFPVDVVEREMQNGVFDSSAGDSAKINLRATTYRKDTSRIVDGCTCFTCQNHTRAYLNHLINVHEMLAQILLEIHNTHHYLRFFRSIQEAIKAGEFDIFWKQFVENRRSQIAAAAM